MAPALAAIGTFALLFAWNDYFYQYMLLMSESTRPLRSPWSSSFTTTMRRGTHDGDRNRIFAAADRSLLRPARLHGGRAHPGGVKGDTARSRRAMPVAALLRKPGSRGSRRATTQG